MPHVTPQILIRIIFCLAALVAAPLASSERAAAQSIKIGVVVPATGVLAETGKQIMDGVRLYEKLHGSTVAGKRIEIIFKDDQARPDKAVEATKELIEREKVAVVAGFALTSSTLAAVPATAAAKIPMVVMGAATAALTERSPYVVRTSYTLGQTIAVLADWAAKNQIKTAVSLVADFGPGHDADKIFQDRFSAAGGRIVASLRMPLASPDTSAFLTRAAAAKPDAIFAFTFGNVATMLRAQFVAAGLDKRGIKLIGPGELSDDMMIANATDGVATLTTHFYSAAHPSAVNRAFVEAFKKAGGGRPAVQAVAAYDGMHLIYEALKKTGGRTDGDALLAAMKGLSWESPRGPLTIDAATREPVHNIYVRRAQKTGGEVFNVEIATYPNVRDPAKGARQDLVASAAPAPSSAVRDAERQRIAEAEAAARRSRDAEDATRQRIAEAEAATQRAREAEEAAKRRLAEIEAATRRPPEPTAAAAGTAGRRIALLIGNSQYKSASPLQNPSRDVDAMAAALRASGFQAVTVRKELPREQIMLAIRDFANQADGADWALFYFSGHGIEFGGTNYIIPVDAQLRSDRDVELEAVDLNKVLTSIDGARKLKLAILDACRNNPFVSGMRRTVASRSLGRGLARVEPDAGTLVVYAAMHGQEALDGDGKNSPFVQSLVRHIGTPNLEIRRLFDYVRDDVMQATNRKQQPFTYGSLPGREDFYFRVK